MTMVGADSAQLHQLGREMETAAKNLERARTALSSQLSKTTWTGADRAIFLGRWTRELAPSLKSASETLRRTGRALHQNASDQELASQSNGDLLARFILKTAPLRDVAHIFERPRTTNLPGDRGGTFNWEPRSPWEAPGGTDAHAGRAALARALNHTADPSQIAPDEFEIVALENGKYIVVLPGVTDLTKLEQWATNSLIGAAKGHLPGAPPLGFDPVHRSVRDLDQGAVSSATGTAMSDNPYALYTAGAMKAYGVPAGSEVALVGHSYGADTVVDLAADPRFNGGPDGYRVTHVLAAGYHTQPNLTAVPGETSVLAIQNNRDLVVLGERAGEGPLQTFEGVQGVTSGAVGRDLGEIWTGAHHVADGSVETVSDAAKTSADAGWDLVAGFRPWNPLGGVQRAADNLLSTDTGTTVTSNGHVNIVFGGGSVGVGHHPSNYADYIVNSDAPEVGQFGGSLAESGYTGEGVATAHDVSVPD